MIVKPITFPNHQPLNRTLAAQVVLSLIHI